MTLIMTAGAIIIVMQGHQFSVISRNLWEYLWAAIVLAQSFIAYMMLAVYAALAFMRHGIMDSSAMAFLCSDKPENGLCLIRHVLGKMMYNQVFGFTSLILAGFALWLNKVNLSFMAILASLCSVMFYNVSMGAIAFVLAGLGFVHKKLYG